MLKTKIFKNKPYKSISRILSLVVSFIIFINFADAANSGQAAPDQASEVVVDEVVAEAADDSFDYYSYAEKLSTIGVFVGTGDGFELYRQPTRIEGLIVLIRLLGDEKEALEGDYPKHPFKDVPIWATKYVNYAYAKGLTKGISETTFGGDDLLMPESFATFVLRALSYNDQAGDFTWDQALDFASSIGLSDEALASQLSHESFNRNLMAKMAYNGLLTNMKAQEDLTLADYLVGKNMINMDLAIKLELIDNPDLLLSDENGMELSGGALVDENGQTPLLGPATASMEIVEKWAREKGMKQEGLDLIPIYYELSQEKGLNPVIQFVQMCLETGYLYKVKSQAGIDASYHNPCGLKVEIAGDGYTGKAFAQFDSWYEGIDAHTDHSALYAGAQGFPRSDSKDPRHFPYLLGTATTVESLSGRWAESDYHTKILKLYNEIIDLTGQY